MGKVLYYVKVEAPIPFPTLVFDKRKDAEAFKKAISGSTTVGDYQLSADIMRHETTEEGYNL